MAAGVPRFVEVGEKFDMLTVLARRVPGEKSVHCRCDCGKLTTVSFTNWGTTRSCGCLRVSPTYSHGMAHTREYRIWLGILARCNNPTKHDYPHYGGRGIKVCKRWLKFENFYADMGPRPEGKTPSGRPIYSIDRIDNDGPYSPKNCKWSTQAEQRRNTRVPTKLTVEAVRDIRSRPRTGQSDEISTLAREFGVSYGVLYNAINGLSWKGV
jgi:hypothetical protein